jgi:hypothetical protein
MVNHMKKVCGTIIVALLIYVPGDAIRGYSFRVSPPQMFDSFGDVCCNDEMAHLDNFALALQNQPDVQGYIIFYGGKHQSYPSCQGRKMLPRHGEAQARAARLKPYLVDTRSLDSARVIVIDGRYREAWTAELWIVPRGASAPTPSPTVKAKDIRYRKGKIKKRAYECEV